MSLEVTVRAAIPGDIPELQRIYRGASLSNDGDRDALLRHPEPAGAGPFLGLPVPDPAGPDAHHREESEHEREDEPEGHHRAVP